MLRKNYLFTPGPTMTPPSVSLAEAEPIIHHRTPEFSSILMDVVRGMKWLFSTEEADLFVLTSSGTGAMEASVVNLLSAGETALFISAGKFGERWGELLETYSVKAIPIRADYGRAVAPSEIEQALKSHPEARALFCTQNETSTGVLFDIQGFAEVTCKTDALLVVDTVSSLGVHPFEMDAWGVDVAVTGSQKGCMLPPGLAFAAVGPRAWERVEAAATPRYYWSFKAMKKSMAAETTPFTPAITLVRAAALAVRMLREEGLENVFQRHADLARATRAGVEALGLKQFARDCPSNALTSVCAPSGINIDAVLKDLRDHYGVGMAGGQGKMKGSMFRIGHMGYVNRFDVLVAIAALETGLKEAGMDFETGAGVAAVQRAFLESG